MYSEETYRIILDHLIRFHVNAVPGIKIYIEQRPSISDVKNKNIPVSYFLYMTCPLQCADAETHYFTQNGKYYSCRTLKDLYQKFISFREGKHFFKKDTSLEEIELQFAIRNIDG